MRTLFLAALALTGCSQPLPTDAPRADAGTGDTVAGLYERAGPSVKPDRICIVGRGADLRFGLVMQGRATSSCTARGHVTRDGSKLRLRIDGAPACNLSATLSGGGLALAPASGAECSYYCGAGAALTAGDFARTGSNPADLQSVADIVGEPLC